MREGGISVWIMTTSVHECRVGSGEDSVQLFQRSWHSYKQLHLINASQQDLVLNR